MFVLPWLRKLGRPGGILALIAGGVAIGGGVWVWTSVGPTNGAAVWSPRGMIAALALIIGGVLVGLQGVALLLQGGTPSPRKTDEELGLLLDGAHQITVCLDCRTVITVAPCEHCGSKSSCLDIRTPQDAANARNLLGLSEEPTVRAKAVSR